jgi:FkbM family methyltransferase
MLNGRPLSLTARNIVLPSNYAALTRAVQVYERPAHAMMRYLIGHGDYPCSVRLRTALGRQEVTLFCSQDAITIHEIFCRGDYRLDPPPQTIVDIGSNIGISALYFLTSSSSAYCDLYEPDPSNVEKLRTNLADFEGRFTLHQTAVADRSGVLPFMRESTGRYGSLDPERWLQATGEQMNVQVEHINTVLDRALSWAGIIDLLKIDTEGPELATVQSIDADLLKRIRHIIIEWGDHKVVIDGFRTDSQCNAVRFTNLDVPSR